MPQLYLCLIASILIAGSGIATDVPFVFDEKFSDLAGYNSHQLERASALSPDLAGVPPVSSPNGGTIEIALATNESANKSSGNNRATKSQRTLYGFVILNQSSLSNATNISSERFDTNLLPAYSMVVLPIVTSPNQDDWFKEGNKNYNNGNYQKAIECYDQAIKLNPQLKEGLCNKGIALCRLGKYQDAIDAFDQAIDICPNYSKAWRSKGHVLEAMGREDEAKQAFQNAAS
jgi:tetratricopeptide (TPR) repeat protein